MFTSEKAVKTSSGRRVKKLIGDKWFPCSFEAIHIGDVFKLYDNEALYTTTDGRYMFKADSLPFMSDGILQVHCSDVENQIETPVAG
jgi:hypothetical protein